MGGDRKERSAISSIQQRWRNGLKLYNAWWEFASPEDKEQYRKAKNMGAALSIEHILKKDLCVKILDDELEAFGIKVPDENGAGPVKIPGYQFSDPVIDWERSAISAAGCRYESVTIGKPSASLCSLVGDKPAPIATMGRPSHVPRLKDLILEMEASGEFERKQIKQKIALIRSRAQEKFPNLFIHATQPSDNTIRKALKEAAQQKDSA